MKKLCTYDKKKRLSKNNVRYHFVSCTYFDDTIPYEDTPYELYFRNDERTEYGVLRFAKRKENPYRNYEMIVQKIINHDGFRRSLLDLETASIWLKSWK